MFFIGTNSGLPLHPIESYSPVGEVLPTVYFNKNFQEAWNALCKRRKAFRDLNTEGLNIDEDSTTKEDFPIGRSETGEARAISRVGGFGRLICRGLIPSGLENVSVFEKEHPRALDPALEQGDLRYLVAVNYWDDHEACFLYPIEDKQFCLFHVVPGRVLENRDPEVSYAQLDKITGLLKWGVDVNTPTCDIWFLESIGHTIPSGLAQFEMMLFALISEAELTPLGEPEIIGECPHALFEVTGDSYASIRLNSDGLAVSLCNLTEQQVQIIEAFSRKTRFLHNHTTEDSCITWIIPYSEPTKESSPTGRGLDLGSETMVRIAQVILKLQRQESFDRLFNHD